MDKVERELRVLWRGMKDEVSEERFEEIIAQMVESEKASKKNQAQGQRIDREGGIVDEAS